VRMAAFLLEVIEGPGTGTSIPLTNAVELGRNPDLQHSLEDEQMSRLHARVEPEAGGAVVSDLGSTNGTYVNDQPINVPRRLTPGDRIRMGLTVIEVRSSAGQRTAVTPRPDVTVLGREVLQPVAVGQLPEEPAEIAGISTFASEEVEAAFVPPGVVDSVARPTARGGPLGRLVDAQVKHRARLAAVVLLIGSALSVILYYVLR
jgi:pSer/pThr/pTyr-binding forkhead associated (FHA) protein